MKFSLTSTLVLLVCLDLRLLVDAKRGRNNGNRRCVNDKCISKAPEPTAIFETTIPIRCPPCDKIKCPVKKPRRCKGGITYGYCECCPECAKVEGESCGGRHSHFGKCDRGLVCEKEPMSPHQTTHIPGPDFTSRSTSKNDWRGKCRRDMSKDLSMECEQKCTPEFCAANPKGICSASDVGVTNQDCQGQCQHTSCSACFFQEEPACKKCSKNNSSCIKKFGKCARKKICTRNKYPCKKNKKIQTGKFLCWVPQC